MLATILTRLFSLYAPGLTASAWAWQPSDEAPPLHTKAARKARLLAIRDRH